MSQREIFAAAWPESTDPADRIAVVLNTRPKFVASRTLRTLAWNNARLLEGDVARPWPGSRPRKAARSRCTAAARSCRPCSDTISSTRSGSGPLFGEGALPGAFHLVDAQRSTTGAVLHVYERAGALRYGAVEVGRETVIFDAAR